MTRKHRKFAMTLSNWTELDALLSKLERPLKPGYWMGFDDHECYVLVRGLCQTLVYWILLRPLRNTPVTLLDYTDFLSLPRILPNLATNIYFLPAFRLLVTSTCTAFEGVFLLRFFIPLTIPLFIPRVCIAFLVYLLQSYSSQQCQYDLNFWPSPCLYEL